MAARRTADLFDHCAMYATASLLRELSHGADFEVSAATAVLEAEPEWPWSQGATSSLLRAYRVERYVRERAEA
jgi:hypothetical protein